MFDSSNFIITLNNNSIVNLTTNGRITLNFTIKNTDTINILYNLSFKLYLGDGISFINSTIDYTNVDENIYSFTNIRDLAPNETNYNFSVTLKLNEVDSNGQPLSFNSIIPCSLQGYCDTSPRGIYDNGNEIIEAISNFSFKVSEYIIYKENPSKILLGEEYYSSLIIQTSKNANILFSELKDILGNGINFLDDLTISGYSSEALNNYEIISPKASINNFTIVWKNVYIPESTTIIIKFKFKGNERYYLNGTTTGVYITHGSQIQSQVQYKISNTTYNYNYSFNMYEVILSLSLSNYIVDINDNLVYKIYFYGNLYHDLYQLSGYLTTSDGQSLSEISSPQFTNKIVSSSGITQLIWNVGTILAGTTATITINGTINSNYTNTELSILSGDIFTVSSSCNAISSATNTIISTSDSTELRIKLPSVTKTITGYFYRDNTPKNSNVLAPGDYVSYKSTYDSRNLKAPSGSIKIFDFYPYITKDILNINYSYSENNYVNTNPVPVEPYGVLWFVNQIPGNTAFDINYSTQIDYSNNYNKFLYNLFKLQVVNSNKISYSSRSQIGFSLGKPNLILNKKATGNNINAIKIGEIYSISSTLINNNGDNVTDAFNITFTETLPNNIPLISTSINANINNSEALNYSIQDNKIIIIIPKLAPGDTFNLSYNIKVDSTLGPNKTFNFISSTTAPYTQAYNENLNNLQYDIGVLNKSISLSSAPLILSITSDSPSKIIGEKVYYTFNITIPSGQRLNSLSPIILIPSKETYLNNAWLNNVPISSSYVNNIITLQPMTNIDSTSGNIIYSYKVECLISDSIVSSINPNYTLETFYGNVNYITLLNENFNIGINNTLTINHPNIDLNIASSNTDSNYKNHYLTNSNNIVYTNIIAENFGKAIAKNINLTVTIPEHLNFNSILLTSPGITYSYNSSTRILTANISNIDINDKKYIIMISNIDKSTYSETKLILTGTINRYYNNLSDTKIYTSDIIFNNEIYINSLISFLPLKPYSLIGSSSAINLSPINKKTKIEYILTNTGEGINSYIITITPIFYEYDLYIGDNFILNVPSNTPVNLNSSFLTNITSGDSRYISLHYTIKDTTFEPYNTLIITAKSLSNSNIFKSIPTTLQDP
ncbi:hypothetical protein [Clostridium thermobutyricum]|uniref:DUF11 domain-containing protein n=1 Tax=Clostridium thermobutyricum DSM 4928 TaxID=1121339 RepID=A0A1V4SVE6_9CLOT|nr:hypothetical protein [Clostridium thermobutyricum]OPX47197.1 hypothetical protein CLTHE_21110 [Clostridium thermobutyricum DSM 4928]